MFSFLAVLVEGNGWVDVAVYRARFFVVGLCLDYWVLL